ncbi:MAG: hypothetical protein HY268_30460 [Deltaproteobacteria bacterium]|nr:hypothetical protein [Deltaproteobacteria bacterium]
MRSISFLARLVDESGLRVGESPGEDVSLGCGHPGLLEEDRGRREEDAVAIPSVLSGNNSAKMSVLSLCTLRSSAAKDEPWTRCGWESRGSIAVGI